MKHGESLLLSTLDIAIGITIWISGVYCWWHGIIVHGVSISHGQFEYTAGYFVGLGLVWSGIIVMFIALRASAFAPSVIPRNLLGGGAGFLIFLALKLEWPLEALILGGLILGLVAWSGIRRGLYSGLISGILCSVIDSFYYVPLFGMGIVVGIEMTLMTSTAITLVMVICGALGGIPSSPTAFYLIPGRGE
jgi:hypothetical protein